LTVVLVSGEDLLGEEVDTAEGLRAEWIRSDRISDVYISLDIFREPVLAQPNCNIVHWQ
jgi:hypothetical protein